MPQAKKWHLSKLHVKVNFVSSIQHLDRKKKILIASENGCAIEIISVLRRGFDIAYDVRLRRLLSAKQIWNELCLFPFFGVDFLIKLFHMTSRRPYWCSKTLKWRPINQSINLFLSIRGMGLPRSSELDAHEWNVDVWR